MFDTHCHLNFKAFEDKVEKVIDEAKVAGVNNFVIPGTDVESSKKAVEIAESFDGVYAAVGIHPHHVFEIIKMGPAAAVLPASAPPMNTGDARYREPSRRVTHLIKQIKGLLESKKVVAVGEVGVDRHFYQKTKYESYRIDEKFIELQKELLKAQIGLAREYDKSLILHNREATEEILKIIGTPAVAKAITGKAVFHCCDPDEDLLNFAKEHNIYIGVDGDVTYNKKKQEFVKKIPLELLVLETDSPFLLPRPPPKTSEVRCYGQANEPKNLPLIAQYISKLLNVSINQLINTTTENAKRLFQLEKY